MKGTDTALHLPAHAEAIREKVEDLWSTLFVEEWTIGGGSVLAARWHHRWSEDLDTGCSTAAWAHTTERNAPEALVERLTQTLLPWRADRVEHTDGTGIQGLEAHAIREPRSTRRIGSLSIYTERGILEPHPSQPVAGSTARAWSTAEILVRKLLGRGNAMLPRDVYDYAVACEREPHAWRQARGNHEVLEGPSATRIAVRIVTPG